ncbi:ribonuclease PH [Acidaminobacter sp. JC074]|uniref:ribonuclease PH n=1 Tax=Acidaminobacter sp. JC074 TaxID=2530199 RepID=UPI002103B239|nr:ribonuclease PH [Acidaminobacter sp. JC074]
MIRIDNRKNDEKRNVVITPDYLLHPEGSVLIEMGNTKVICTATVEEKVPNFLKGQNKGWVTAEYSMLPRSTHTRKIRDIAKGKLDGRTSEIQRLIGRSLRSIVDLEKLGERTIWLDCDVIQADGGTRTASITGAFVAMVMAMKKLKEAELIEEIPVTDHLAAISVGILEDEVILDLCYEEDSTAMIDMNVIMTGSKQIVEVQGTGEERPFTRDEMNKLMDFAEKGVEELVQIQKDILGE